MVRGHTVRGLAALGLLAACNIDALAAQFHATQPPADTTDGTSGSSEAGESSSSGSSGASASSSSSGAPEDETSSGSGESTDDEATATSASEATTSPVSVCGDGIVEGEEECDDPGDSNCFDCSIDRMVFVTSKVFDGDWALAGYHYWCNHLAAVAGLIGPAEIRFKPWISDSEASAAEQLHHSRGRYVMVNGLVFAESWEDLVAGNILNPLVVDENSETQVAPVWSDTRPDGTTIAADDGTHCDGWTSDSVNLWGYFGSSDQVDGGWTLYMPESPQNPRPCGASAALYCFEQP